MDNRLTTDEQIFSMKLKTYRNEIKDLKGLLSKCE